MDQQSDSCCRYPQERALAGQWMEDVFAALGHGKLWLPGCLSLNGVQPSGIAHICNASLTLGVLTTVC